MTMAPLALACVASGGSLGWPAVEVFLAHAGLQPASLTIFNPQDASPSSRPAPGSAAAGLACVGPSRVHNREVFAAFAAALAPGASLFVHGAAAAGSEDVSKDLLLSGFTNVQAATGSGVELVRASKPSFDVGAKSLLRKQPAPAPAPAPAPTKAWAIAADDNDELMDDDELLTEEDKRPVAPPKAGDDCEVGASGRKACKNCSCGRAEAEAQGEKAKLTPEMLENPVSACGNCSLGDAFRCAGCPYKGLPAFEAGKKIELPRDMLVADV